MMKIEIFEIGDLVCLHSEEARWFLNGQIGIITRLPDLSKSIDYYVVSVDMVEYPVWPFAIRKI